MSRILRRATRVFLLAVLVVGHALGQSSEERLSPAPEGAFSIVIIPDTQAYRGRETKATPASSDPVTNAILDSHAQWIVDNLRRQRIVFVSHVGDIVDRKVPEQWAVARRALDRLHFCVPYGLALGNHDMKANGDATLFQHQFPAARFAPFPWYGGTFPEEPQLPESRRRKEAVGLQAETLPPSPRPTEGLPGDSQTGSRFGNNANSFQLFSAGGLEFVILHLECNAPDPVLRWADQVLARHASRRALVTTHMGLGPLVQPKTEEDFFTAPKGRMRWKKVHGAAGNTPQQMWDKCFRRHANLGAIFSGDQSRTQAMRLVSRNDAGRPVHEILSDYMQTTGSGDCWLRICRFLPAEDRIDVFTVDSRNSRLCPGTKLVPQRDQHQFRLDYAMRKEPER